MGKFLRLVNGIPRMLDQEYQDEARLTVVGSSPGPNQILGPIPPNTPITIPGSITYTDNDLNIYLNRQRLIPFVDYSYVGTPPRTQVSFTFQLLVGDDLYFEKY